jgi:hypothetical protein
MSRTILSLALATSSAGISMSSSRLQVASLIRGFLSEKSDVRENRSVR